MAILLLENGPARDSLHWPTRVFVQHLRVLRRDARAGRWRLQQKLAIHRAHKFSYGQAAEHDHDVVSLKNIRNNYFLMNKKGKSR